MDAWKRISIPCSGNCSLCNQPECIDYCLLCHFCRSMMRRFSGALCNGHLKEGIGITLYTIHFLPFEDVNRVSYDVIVVLGLFSLWECCMTDRHAESPRPTKCIFGTRRRWCRARMLQKVIHRSGCLYWMRVFACIRFEMGPIFVRLMYLPFAVC